LDDRPVHVGLTGLPHLDAALAHLVEEAFPGEAGDQHLGAIERMRSGSAESVKDLRRAELDPFGQHRRTLRVDLEQQPPLRLTGVTADPATIPTADDDLAPRRAHHTLFPRQPWTRSRSAGMHRWICNVI